MMNGAKKRLATYNVDYLIKDYSEIKFSKNYDIVVSVIGMHHQTNEGKKKVFKEIYECLAPNGIFILGDLVTYNNKNKAAINDAKHYHHLVKKARNEKALEEWAYHHKFLNVLTPIESQIEWLKEAGFSKVNIEYEHLNTALIIAIR